MVGHDERPFEVVHRWIKEGFKLSMDEKWRFVFTFSQEAQNRLLRKTKRLLFSQVCLSAFIITISTIISVRRLSSNDVALSCCRFRAS
jgi:hypothetical protein